MLTIIVLKLAALLLLGLGTFILFYSLLKSDEEE
jgi:hypothetical protein